MKPTEILTWLRETDAARLEELWRRADRVRRTCVGDQVHRRGLVEFSNVCRRDCTYCGLRKANLEIQRYRMSADEILACVRQALRFGYGTVVLQSGEDTDMSAEWLAAVVRRIKQETGLAVTLSVGEREVYDYHLWREAGADRYLLRFETSNPQLLARIHPPLTAAKQYARIELLSVLRDLDYEVGSGVMVGIPGQTWEDLAADLELFRQLDLDMIGIGPFIPHPATPLGRNRIAVGEHDRERQPVPADELTTCKVVALARIACPHANIPSTTALATLDPEQGRELGLCRGANIVMPNLTPPAYRALYEIYPGKACVRETAEDCAGCMRRRIESIGRTVGTGPGTSPNYRMRHRAPERSTVQAPRETPCETRCENG